MKLTDGEKVIIALLADIHKGLKIQGEIDVDRLMASVYGGHLWSLKWDMSGLLHEHEDSPDAVRQTVDILDMWDMVELSFADLGDDEKARVRAVNHGHDPQFSGFDGNNESEFLGIARHLIEDMGRWDRFRGRGLNSHMPSVVGYLRMHGVFEPIRAELGRRPNVRLTADEIIGIIEGRVNRDG